MKRILLITILLISSAIVLQSQVKLGGVSLVDLSADTYKDYEGEDAVVLSKKGKIEFSFGTNGACEIHRL